MSVPHRIVDYDSGYDYLAFWGTRDYEHWVEARLLGRLLPRLGHPSCFGDFGGGFGRNAAQYLRVAERALLVDYSVANLSRAAQLLSPQIASGRVLLLRADLARLPLRDRALDAAMVVRVLHHLDNLDACLAEMARVVDRAWLLDVPIKHHLLGRARALARGRYRELVGPEPLRTGSTDYPFYTFQLGAVRDRLSALGFATRPLASVNNFRRWDQLLPAPAVRALSPLVYTLELGAQRAGRGWWGPSQFLLARRPGPSREPLPEAAEGVPEGLRELSRRLVCPACHGPLRWLDEGFSCPACGLGFRRRQGFWDFALPAQA